jgi:hypothetical protein
MTRNDSTKRRARSAARRRHRARLDTATRLLCHAHTLLAVLVLLAALTSAVLAVLNVAAYAATPDPTAPTVGVTSLQQVIDNIRVWLFGLLVAVATLFLTIGGVRLMWANGDPGEAEKGKAALRSAAIGYGLALLAPLIVTIVGGWVA